jgi:lipopolysaccharide-induced tumor necrosis factor-alpha factor
MDKKIQQEEPPAYVDFEESSPLLANQQIPILLSGRPIVSTTVTAHFQPLQPVPLQVVVASTNQPVPIRIIDGNLYLTVVEPVRMFCPHCNQMRTTIISQQAKYCAYASCVFMFIFCQPFCFIPFCLNTCKELVHSCDGCNYVLATVLQS